VLTRAQTLNPLNTDHTANLARFYRSRGELQTSTIERERDWQTALTYYQAATRLSPNAAHLFNEKGLVYFLLANLARDQQQPEVADDYFEDALIALSRSLELDQIYPQTYLFLGDVYRSRGDNAKAIEAYQQTLKLSPGQALAWSALGYIYAQQGNLTEAISANQKVTQLSPGDAASWRNLAILYQQTNQIQLALAAAQEALKYAPDADKPALQALVQQLQAQLPQ
jgi:tetratricopeptide (TPR) repeat protein